MLLASAESRYTCNRIRIRSWHDGRENKRESASTNTKRPAAAAIVLGKAVAAKVRATVTARAAGFADQFARRPGLAVVQVGEHPASSVYVRNKRKSSIEVGIELFAFDLPVTTSEAELLALIEHLNRDERVDATLAQLPLPQDMNTERVMDAIDLPRMWTASIL